MVGKVESQGNIMSKINKDVEKFFLETIPKRREKEGLVYSMSDCHKACMNYYLEIEHDDLFHSDDYDNEEDRAYAMFGFLLTKEEHDLISYKFYKSRSDSKGEDHEKRIKELEGEITDPELVAVMPMVWWAS